jgi:hypothetical protein
MRAHGGVGHTTDVGFAEYVRAIDYTALQAVFAFTNQDLAPYRGLYHMTTFADAC